ncbi:MAG: hypothetical protein Q9219_001799 [cf. Caloplaca sp. 3 TL-2023]
MSTTAPVASEPAPTFPIRSDSFGLTSTPFFVSTLDHLKASASNATAAFNTSALFGRIPRWFGPLTDGFGWLQSGRGSVIADATGERAIGIETIVQGSAGAQGAAASTAAGGPAMGAPAPGAFRNPFTLQHVRNFGGIFAYVTSKWAVTCFLLAIVLNRTKIFTSGRRNINLTFALRLALRIAPIVMFLAHTQSILQAIRCQTSPDYSSLKYGNASTHFDLDFASNGGMLYQSSSNLLFWQDDLESCQAVNMAQEPSFKGSFSLLWPLFKTLCVGQFVETLSCAVQGRPIMTETGMSVFEHSLAFAEAEAMISSYLGLGLYGLPPSDTTKLPQSVRDTFSVDSWLARSLLFNRLNTTPEVLLMGLISCLNNLSSHILALFDLQNRFRLLNTGVWGLCFLASFIWGFFGFDQGTDAGGISLRFPTVCIVGFIPHLLVLVAIFGCALIYLIALTLAVLSPPVGIPQPQSWKERLEVAQDNLQANVHFSGVHVSMHEDFYTALLKVGFTSLTVASDAVFLNEGKRIGVHRWTWLEEERLKEIQQTSDYARERLEHEGTANLAGGVTITEVRPSIGPERWKSGYARERDSKSLKPVPGLNARAEGGGVGALQRSGRYMGAWDLLSGIFWLTTGWMALLSLRILRKMGFKKLPPWMKTERPNSSEKGKLDVVKPRLVPHTNTLDFWMLSDDGVLSLPPSNDIDVEIETRKRIRMNSDGWGAQEERTVDSTLYNWWAHGGWWGDRDESGEFHDPHDNDDLTSEISLTESHADNEGWASDDDDNESAHQDGRTTPTQRNPHPRYDSRESTPSFPDYALDATQLARMLNPQNNEQRREAHMLAQHLSSDSIVTRSQYRRSTGHDRHHLLTSNPRNHPLGFRPSMTNGKLTPAEEAIVLEHLLLTKRASNNLPPPPPSHRASGDENAWASGAEGMGAAGPQCVVCQSAPRTVLAWPCRCLSLCEDCRVSLAMNNFGSCVCCRQEVVGFSRLFVP